MTLIAIQDEYIETVNAGIARWSHRPKNFGIGGGHADRILRGATRRAETRLHKVGFTDKAQIAQVIRDARDMALLEREAA